MYKRRQRSTCYPGTAYRKQDSFFNRILPKYSRIPLLFTVVLNFSVYWGARAIAGGFIHHNIETSLDDMIPVVYPTVVIYFGCYIFLDYRISVQCSDG